MVSIIILDPGFGLRMKLANRAINYGISLKHIEYAMWRQCPNLGLLIHHLATSITPSYCYCIFIRYTIFYESWANWFFTDDVSSSVILVNISWNYTQIGMIIAAGIKIHGYWLAYHIVIAIPRDIPSWMPGQQLRGAGACCGASWSSEAEWHKTQQAGHGRSFSARRAAAGGSMGQGPGTRLLKHLDIWWMIQRAVRLTEGTAGNPFLNDFWTRNQLVTTYIPLATVIIFA